MLSPIKTTQQHNNALARIYELLQIGVTEGTEQADELEILSILVEAYEKKFFPFPKANPIEAVMFRMEQLGISKQEMLTILAA
jgi:HTH-type transcriptional regulator / antitoxin HigA